VVSGDRTHRLAGAGCIVVLCALVLSSQGCDPSPGPGPSAAPPPPAVRDEATFLAKAAARSLVGTVVTSNGVRAADAVVAIVSGLPARAWPPTAAATIAQRNKTFLPTVLPVVVGSTVTLTNDDSVSHNVYSRSNPKAFDLGMYQAPERRTVLFEKPGKVDLFCAVHPNMHATVLVLENPYFATTDASGLFEIADLPPGTYGLRVWHRTHGEHESTVTIDEKRATTVAIRFSSQG
jgi:plastocyanin